MSDDLRTDRQQGGSAEAGARDTQVLGGCPGLRETRRDAGGVARLELHRRPHHGQQPNGGPPRLGADIQGPLGPLQVHERPRGPQPERLRLPGPLDRSRGGEGPRLQVEEGHRGVRHRRVRQEVQAEGSQVRSLPDGAVHPTRNVDRLGRPRRAPET